MLVNRYGVIAVTKRKRARACPCLQLALLQMQAEEAATTVMTVRALANARDELQTTMSDTTADSVDNMSLDLQELTDALSHVTTVSSEIPFWTIPTWKRNSYSSKVNLKTTTIMTTSKEQAVSAV
jgi:hypothetical protein